MHHWSMLWLGAQHVTRHYMKQCWFHCQWDPWEQISQKFESNYNNFLFKWVHLKMLSAYYPPFCLGLDVLTLVTSPNGIDGYAKISTKWIRMQQVLLKLHKNDKSLNMTQERQKILHYCFTCYTWTLLHTPDVFIIIYEQCSGFHSFCQDVWFNLQPTCCFVIPQVFMRCLQYTRATGNFHVLILYALNFSEWASTCIYILCHSSALIRHK